MQKHSLKFVKVFTNIACSPLIFISNNSELAAKYLPNEVKQSMKTIEIRNNNYDLFKGLYPKNDKRLFIAENKENINQENVFIKEIIIEGWENHPEGRKLELHAYDAMSIKPNSIESRPKCNICYWLVFRSKNKVRRRFIWSEANCECGT